MEITWLGHSCFRLRSRDSFVVTDPCGKSTGYTLGRPPASVVTVSHDHPGHNTHRAGGGRPADTGGQEDTRRSPRPHP